MILIYKSLSESSPHLVKMDTTKDPAEPVFAEYPKSEITLVKEQLEQQQADLDYLKLISGDEEV